MQVNVGDAYPKVIFTDIGIYYGMTKEILVEPRSSKTYSYTFQDIINATEAKVVMMTSGDKEITNELTVECTSED